MGEEKRLIDRKVFSFLLLALMVIGLPLHLQNAPYYHLKPALSPLSRRNGWQTVSVFAGNSSNKPEQSWAAQAGQDRTIATLHNNRSGGYFVDLASNDAVEFSNTFALERVLNWTGLCIEANPQYMQGYVQRQCRLVQAVAGAIDNALVNFTANGALGGVVDTNFDNKQNSSSQFLAVSLAKVLQDHNAPSVIDYLSLDIEGAEEWVMSTFPWHKYVFLSITVERPKPGLVAMLEANGYVYVCNHANFGDELWVHKTISNFSQIVAKYKKVARGSPEAFNDSCRR